MKANEAPEKLWWSEGAVWHTNPNSERYIEYARTDAFIEKARNWFEQQPELYDANGVRVYGEEDFEDFRKYMEGE